MNKHDISVILMICQSIPNKFYDSIGGKRPLIVFGYYDTSTFVKMKDIGWAIEFDKEAIETLLSNLNRKEYYEKYHNICIIRKYYSKNVLYQDIITLVEKIINTGDKK